MRPRRRKQIRTAYPEMGVLVLSQYLDSRYALRLLEDFPERVGYLLKERVSDVAVLTDAIRRVADGETVIDPTIVSRLMKRQRAPGPLGELATRIATSSPSWPRGTAIRRSQSSSE